MMRADDLRSSEPTRYGCYVCLGVPRGVRRAVAGSDVASVAERLGFANDLLKYMQLADKLGQITTLEFNNVQKNPSLDASLFLFKVPEGADVIGDAGTAASAP